MSTNGIRDLAALAADDAEIERTLTAEDRAALASVEFDWDARVESMEERQNRRALVYCLPIIIASIVIILIARGGF